MKRFLLLIVNVGLVTLMMIGAVQVGTWLSGGPEVRMSRTIVSEPVALPVVTRHGGDVHIVLDDGTLFVVPESGCVVIVRADEHEGTCLG